MDWIISITTIVSVELAVRKNWWTWVITLANQGLWMIYIVQRSSWGLVPLNLFMTLMAVRGLYAWTRKTHPSNAGAERGNPRVTHDCESLGS